MRFCTEKIKIRQYIGIVFLIISAILFISGIFRAVRVRDPIDISECTAVSEGDWINGSPDAVYGCLKNETNPHSILWKSTTAYDHYIINIAGQLRPLSVPKYSEQNDWIKRGANFKAEKGMSFVGIATDRYSDGFFDYIANIYDSYESIYDPFEHDTKIEISLENCSELGIKIVNPFIEKISWLKGLPFLIIGLILIDLTKKYKSEVK